LTAGSLYDVFESMLTVAQALGVSEQGRELVARERGRLDRLRAMTAPLRRPSVVVLEWIDPLFPMSNWGPELVDAAGGEVVLGGRNQHSSAIASEQLVAADPEYLVIAPCGFDLDRTIRETAVLERHDWWAQLRAVREGKVAFADGNRFFNRSGMTVVRSSEIMAEILHGVIAEERTENRHWVPIARARESWAA
jgi:iron complex transport system substrate-binding protein